MTTEYSDIYDLFLTKIKDWKLDTLYNVSIESFEGFLQGFLVPTIPEFDPFCTQSLARDDDAGTFDETLTFDNKVELSKLMLKFWLEREINDIKQLKLHVGDKDFRIASEANNLRAKQSYYELKLEEISQSLIEYTWYNHDMTDWTNGTFAAV